MIPAPVAVADGRNRNPFSTAEEIINETVNSLEGQPTEMPEKVQEDYASKTIDNKSFTQSKTDIKTSDNISKKSIDNKTTISMPKKAALGSTQGTTEVTLGENGAETFYAAFELCRDNGGIIHITRDCDTSDGNTSESQDTIVIESDITLDIQEGATVSGIFEVLSEKLTITGNDTFAATCIVYGGTLNIESGKITGKLQKSGSGEIVAPNYVLTENNGYLYANEAVCRIGEKSFAKLETAIGEADGKTITVIANIINEPININKHTTFSLIVCEDFCVRGNAFKNSGASITIKNGKFDTPITNESGTLFIENGIFLQAITNKSGTISITGGTFSEDVSAYCAEGYECLQISGTGMFQVAPIIEAQIVEANGTVQEKGLLSTMLNKASAGQTVQLLRNCDYSNTEIYITKSIAFDLNGFNLISKCYTVTNANTIDTATLTDERSPGLLLSADGYSFKEENTYLPMFDILEGANGYRFFAYTIARYEPKEQKEVVQKSGISGEIQTLKYKYAIRFVNPIGYKILAQGDSRVNLCIGVTWDGSEKRFDLTTASVDALKKYGQSCWDAAQNQQTKYYSMFVRFWNYQNTLVGKETSYCLYVNAMNGTLPITKTDICSFEVKGEQQ